MTDTRIDVPLTLQQAANLAYDKLHACGCMCGSFLTALQVGLEYAADENHKWAEFTKDRFEGPAYCVLALLDDAELIEHGTSIRNPWLTVAGRVFLQALRDFDHDAIIEAGWVMEDEDDEEAAS